MEYLYVLAAFVFVTVIALMLKAKRAKEEKTIKDKERDLIMEEKIKASAEMEARKKTQQTK
ncbi:MAG: hypothetical protein V7749_13325 [Cocleimonas sp.]